ncbi:MAG: hypothetical protein M2R45_04970 [Verrucomicrobia subdivision 3 bacterium]|nr:hypothetical protein [Limisphaerales bacterium]
MCPGIRRGPRKAPRGFKSFQAFPKGFLNFLPPRFKRGVCCSIEQKRAEGDRGLLVKIQNFRQENGIGDLWGQSRYPLLR